MSTETRVVDRARAAIRGLSPYQPGKPIDELERELGITGAVKLASNENPRGPGPDVQAAIDRARAELTRYPDGNGFALKQKLAARLDATPDRSRWGTAATTFSSFWRACSLGPAMWASSTSIALWSTRSGSSLRADRSCVCHRRTSVMTWMRWPLRSTSVRAFSTSRTRTIRPVLASPSLK